jgi:hypothetical protein
MKSMSRHVSRCQRSVGLLVIGCCVIAHTTAMAQTVGQKIEGELSGNVFFGNTRQILAALRAEHERIDSASSVRTQLRYNYGQTTTDATGTIVSKRSWIGASSYDWRPFARVSPFVRASLESSLESQIARRYRAGGGARLNIIRTAQTDVIASAGIDGERTTPLSTGNAPGSTTLARGNTSLRLRRDFNPTMSASSETSYSPALSDFGDYTILSVTALKMKLTSTAGLTLSFRDGFDSRAVARGARSNNDGEILVGVLTTF